VRQSVPRGRGSKLVQNSVTYFMDCCDVVQATLINLIKFMCLLAYLRSFMTSLIIFTKAIQPSEMTVLLKNRQPRFSGLTYPLGLYYWQHQQIRLENIILVANC